MPTVTPILRKADANDTAIVDLPTPPAYMTIQYS